MGVWLQFQRAAAEAGVDLSAHSALLEGVPSRVQCIAFACDVLQPPVLPRNHAISYWTALVDVLKSRLTVVQTEDVEGDQGLAEDEDSTEIALHADFASQASGVVNVHDVDAAMY
jgi:hypothetical protein